MTLSGTLPAVIRHTIHSLCRGLIGAMALTFCLISPARSECRQALALALDVSGSVDSREYQLQLGGLAAALRHPEVTQALLAVPSAPVQLAVYEWSSSTYQRVLLNWTAITDRTTILKIAAQLEATARLPTTPETALGNAMQYGAAMLASQSTCWKRTLDISGDGKHNQGPHPRDVKLGLQAQSLTINALVIGSETSGLDGLRQVESGELRAYFDAWVILGPDAFVEVALGFEEYEAAMVRKLKRELQGPVLSSVLPHHRDLDRPARHTRPIHQ